MNEFDRRWQTGAARAREVKPAEPAAAPHGFAQRVLARARATPATPLERICERLTWRALAGACAVLAASLFLELPAAPADESFLPAVETVATELFWTS